MSASVATNYAQRLILTADSGADQSFAFTIEVPAGIDFFTVQACVHTGSEYAHLSGAIRFSIADFMQGETAIFGHSFALDIPEGLQQRFEANGRRAAQLMIFYRTNRGEEEYLPVPNVVMINRRYNPGITAFSVERYAFGEIIDDGTQVLASGTLELSSNQAVMPFELRLYYAMGKNVDMSADFLTIGSITESPCALNRVIDAVVFANTQDYAFMLWFGDEFEHAVQYGQIFEAFANLHLSGKANGGVCMGGFSTSTDAQPKFECHYPAYFYGGIALGGAQDYSADEADTGVKWIDGRPVYRKVVQIGSIANSASKDTALNTGAMGAVVSVRGMGFTSAGIVRPIPFVNPNNTTDNTSLTVRSYASAPVIRINTGSSGALANAVVIVEYTKAGEVDVNNTLDYGELDIMILA